MTTIRIAVASDLHAFDVASQDSHVVIEPPSARPNQQPLSDLVAFVSNNSISADLLFVPGDIANHANTPGLSYGWRRLHELASAMGAQLLAVPGNHDVVTHEPVADPRAPLKNLVPTFPSGEAVGDDAFWEQGWLLLEYPEHRVLLLDSTRGFPPYPVGAPRNSKRWRKYLRSLDRGSFSRSIEDELETIFKDLTPKLNLAMVHHHPMEHQMREHLQDEYGPMKRGSDLIDLLSRHPDAGRWILIHGHKHIPQLSHAIGATANGPLLLCAASVGGKLWSPINTVTRNQFHLLTAENDPIPGTSSIRGTVENYTWGFGQGWIESERMGAGLPANTGFGCSEDFRSVADRLVDLMETEDLEFISIASLLRRTPYLPHILPADFSYLEIELEKRGFGFDRNRLHKITQLTRLEARR